MLRPGGIDLHGHGGRCFLAGLDAAHPLVQMLGPPDIGGALAAATAAGLAAVSLATVSDLAVLQPESTGLRAHRSFAPGEAVADHRRQLDGILRSGFALATSPDDLSPDGPTRVLLGCEGGDFLEGDLSRLEEARAAGVTTLTLVHYRVNELGDVQTEPPVHGGLTPSGREVVACCNQLGILVDCAHATYRTTLDVLDASTQPVTISHSHLQHPEDEHARLLSVAHAAAVADAGGVIGAWPCGLTSQSLEDFADEVARLVEAVGAEHVAIGTDLDGNYRPVLTGYDQFEALDERLRRLGLDETELDRVFGGSAAELLRTVWGASAA